ncbi:ABC transporter substrate-binding protein [Blastococcus sp. TF02A-30]|uniref:ABC transporter substrate-binding protein n=1 Tax=Blastococcus sp. TF02A-30 TaxID=2250580 RepID=UPI000DE8805C|nr:ABC transporter substrate-binding protein [Blastococcus sp. TF02A-30]RBY84868.1 ABC transporter substrate-binding protein [Blastococcus sp. TF02A-30]
MPAPLPRRRHRRLLSLVTAVGLTAVLTGCAGSADAGTGSDADGALVDLVLGAPATSANGLSSTPQGVIGYALADDGAQDLLAEHGFRYTEFAAFENGPPAAQALASGSLQLAAIGESPALLSRAAGQQNRALVVLSSPGGTWIAGREGGPTSIADLAGATVGVQFGSNFDRYLRTALGEEGLTDEVQLVNLLVADGYGALTGGSIDAYAAPAASVGLWAQKGGVQVIDKAEESHPDYRSALVTLVNEDFLAEHPELPDAWWELYRLGLDKIQADPEAYYAWVSETLGYPVDVVRDTTVLVDPQEPASDEDIASLEEAQEFLVEQGLAKEPFDVAEWVVR